MAIEKFDPKNYDIRELFHDSYAEEVFGDAIADDLQTRAVDFLLWCNTPVYEYSAEGFFKHKIRVIAQFPEYGTFVVIDNQGNKRHEEPFITANQVYDLYLEDIM